MAYISAFPCLFHPSSSSLYSEQTPQRKDAMPAHPDDRVLWIVIGGGLLIAANAIPHYLKYIRKLIEARNDELPSKRPCEDAQDALKLSTLKTLMAGPSYKLRTSALKIIAERSTRDASRKLLLKELAGKNPARRNKALNALWLLLSHSSLKDSPEVIRAFVSDTSTFAAIVDCLTNLLPLHEDRPSIRADNPTAASPLLPYNRPSSEKLALFILRNLLFNQSTLDAQSASLISKWLKQYPFPCALPENGGKRQDVLKLFKKWGSDDPLMSSIMTIILWYPEGRKQLRRQGLTGSSYCEEDDEEDEADLSHVEDVFMVDGEDTAGAPLSVISGPRPDSSSSQRRTPDPSSSWADRAARQRRREAAVYSEGDAPLTQENIFQRQPPNPEPIRELSAANLDLISGQTDEELSSDDEEVEEVLRLLQPREDLNESTPEPVLLSSSSQPPPPLPSSSTTMSSPSFSHSMNWPTSLCEWWTSNRQTHPV